MPEPAWAILRRTAGEAVGRGRGWSPAATYRAPDLGARTRWRPSGRPVAYAAWDLLISGPLDRVKRCHACPWLYLDQSKNGSRRWCSMEDCGKAVKMSRYVAKRAAAARSSSAAMLLLLLLVLLHPPPSASIGLDLYKLASIESGPVCTRWTFWGDPVRRRILEVLAEGEHAAGEVVTVISAEFGISPAGGFPAAPGAARSRLRPRPPVLGNPPDLRPGGRVAPPGRQLARAVPQVSGVIGSMRSAPSWPAAAVPGGRPPRP